ncbi:MAG TPA: hypothetical protein VEQ36_12425 [Thermomicrobiales bacterium]|nr:hypothetical protein [Thermomicrobiales bacterium]
MNQMRLGAIVFFWSVVALLPLASSGTTRAATTSVSSGAHSSHPQTSECFDYDFHSMFDPTTQSLREPEPAALEGQFPDIHGYQGSPYRVDLSIEPGDSGQVSDVSLDGHTIVFGNVVFDDYGDIPRAPTITSEQVERFLATWSRCAATGNTMAIIGFIDSTSYTWLCDAEDRFQVQASPLALLCFGSGARTRGSLPLELYFVGLLSDGRAVAVVGEGTNHDACGIQLGFRNYVSIWVLELNGDKTLIRAAIGGLEVYSDDFTVIGETSCADDDVSAP